MYESQDEPGTKELEQQARPVVEVLEVVGLAEEQAGGYVAQQTSVIIFQSRDTSAERCKGAPYR